MGAELAIPLAIGGAVAAVIVVLVWYAIQQARANAATQQDNKILRLRIQQLEEVNHALSTRRRGRDLIAGLHDTDASDQGAAE